MQCNAGRRWCAGALPDREQQHLDNVNFDDSDAIQKLSKFDNFGSLSDLGSLFSSGPVRSRDVRSSVCNAPRTNLSIASPHSLMTAAKTGVVESMKDEAVAAAVPSTPV